MKVAYILPTLQKPSGWRSHASAFINAMRRHVEPALFVSAADFEAAKTLFPGDQLYRLPVTQQASIAQRRGAIQLAKSLWTIRRNSYPRFDLVHSLEAYPTGLVGSWLAQKQRRPHVITTHGTYGVVWHERKPDRILYERVLRNTQMVCPVSQGTATLLQRYFGKALTNTHVRPILNGNDYYKTIPGEEALNHHFPDIPAILSVGDVKFRKGQHLSLAAFAEVKRHIPKACYQIAGFFKQNEYYHELQRFVAEHELQDVTFLGAISESELRRRYREASLFVLTPQQDGLHFEGFGLVYLEAGAYGLPVVATKTGGVPDAVQDGVTGLLAEPGDVNAIAEAILRLLSDRDLARRMGQANRRWAEHLTWERNAQEQVQAYRYILES